MAIVPFHDLLRAQTFYEKMLGLIPSEGSLSGGEAVYSLRRHHPTRVPDPGRVGRRHEDQPDRRPDLDKTMADLKTMGSVFEELGLPYLKTIDGVSRRRLREGGLVQGPRR